jgi:Ran GTPase-activating protein (RanGAP) involved in mRNA processing and transport
MIKELTVGQTVEEIRKIRGRYDELEKSLILRAQLQQVTEIEYNHLVQLAKEGIEFLERCQAGDVVDAEWIRSQASR